MTSTQEQISDQAASRRGAQSFDTTSAWRQEQLVCLRRTGARNPQPIGRWSTAPSEELGAERRRDHMWQGVCADIRPKARRVREARRSTSSERSPSQQSCNQAPFHGGSRRTEFAVSSSMPPLRLHAPCDLFPLDRRTQPISDPAPPIDGGEAASCNATNHRHDGRTPKERRPIIILHQVRSRQWHHQRHERGERIAHAHVQPGMPRAQVQIVGLCDGNGDARVTRWRVGIIR